jgi:hypothetical protein
MGKAGIAFPSNLTTGTFLSFEATFINLFTSFMAQDGDLEISLQNQVI